VDQLSLFQRLKIGGHKDVIEKVNAKALSKFYYSISEVAELFDLNASVLRYWEKEFPKQLSKIKKNKKGDRHYSKQNIGSLNNIYYLLRERKMTIEGARDLLNNQQKGVKEEVKLVEHLESIKSFLTELQSALKESN